MTSVTINALPFSLVIRIFINQTLLFANNDFGRLHAFAVEQASDKSSGTDPGDLNDFRSAFVKCGGILVVRAAHTISLKDLEIQKVAVIEERDLVPVDVGHDKLLA